MHIISQLSNIAVKTEENNLEIASYYPLIFNVVSLIRWQGRMLGDLVDEFCPKFLYALDVVGLSRFSHPHTTTVIFSIMKIYD